jgi:hypothetical protein
MIVSFFLFLFFFSFFFFFYKWANHAFVYIYYRKVNSSPRMGFQRHHSQMGGKEMLGSMQLGSQGEGCLVHPQMP